MRKFNHLQKVLIGWIIGIAIFGCVMIGLRQNALSDMGYSAWTYIQYGLFEYPLTSIGNFVNDVANLWHQYDDNQYLTQELAEQKSYKTLYDNERNENKELQDLLNMKNELGNSTQISARVIKRSSSSWDQYVTISAGSAQGVKENMIVVTSEGAVGLVQDTQTNTSKVQLLTDEDLENDISVKISMEDGSTAEGLIDSYDPDKKAYRMSLFDSSVDVSAGMEVATSGKGGNYPSGIYIGTVRSVEQNDNSIVSTIYVTPVSNISSFNYVIVLGNGKVSE
ncbi:rod shape-determining protein MreC [Catenisphaera adipataccumulans]|uniref:Cell shape-determining protein MreC n=1 Tax=Catenisphaera adipataccumulans TaxID=700500 RepID=A0A7W8CY98_9FIRM|nr:rod shape-determining protein MreC [Catenisphaera adipataccumulans]MBB5183786.1 rod shape-determining protein MreC [Catenisphaera adipataccumulans]